ncbi:MAG: hypothetical protein SFV32_07135 [Opitutaceae bacterium]|nr:hypothetical protein [Opitutaceae bacterium]
MRKLNGSRLALLREALQASVNMCLGTFPDSYYSFAQFDEVDRDAEMNLIAQTRAAARNIAIKCELPLLDPTVASSSDL